MSDDPTIPPNIYMYDVSDIANH